MLVVVLAMACGRNVAPPEPDPAPALPDGHPAVPPGTSVFPSNHPPTAPAPPVATASAMAATSTSANEGAAEPKLVWKTPARWQTAPNPSSMRLATFRIPRAAGDEEDGDVSVMQAGGSVEANVARWKGQFDSDAQKAAKTEMKKFGGLEVTVVEIAGAMVGSAMPGMGEQAPKASWMLLAAIVEVPGTDPYFFKATGPKATIGAARGELDALLATLAVK